MQEDFNNSLAAQLLNPIPEAAQQFLDLEARTKELASNYIQALDSGNDAIRRMHDAESQHAAILETYNKKFNLPGAPIEREETNLESIEPDGRKDTPPESTMNNGPEE